MYEYVLYEHTFRFTVYNIVHYRTIRLKSSSTSITTGFHLKLMMCRWSLYGLIHSSGRHFFVEVQLVQELFDRIRTIKTRTFSLQYIVFRVIVQVEVLDPHSL